jgi:hypothetical protein
MLPPFAVPERDKESSGSMKYQGGQIVSLGDRMKLWKGQHGTVVCSIDTGEFTNEFPEAEWGYVTSGIMVRTDGGELFHYGKADEDFEQLPGSDS